MGEASGFPIPEVSFLSAAYRTEAHIAAMIDSVRAQRRPDWELVVVDNGMSDEIARIVTSYGDPRIRLVRHENRGYVGAVQSAAAVARGRWFAVLNSDDTITPDYLEHLLGLLDADPTIDALAPDAELVVGDRVLRRTFTRGHPRMRDVTRPLSLSDLFDGLVPHYTGLVRRDAWLAVGGFRESGRFEELALWLDLVVAGYHLHVTDRPVSRWRLEADSISHQLAGKLGQEASRTVLMQEAYRRGGGPADHDALVRGLALSAYEREWTAFRTAIRTGDVREARRAIDGVVAIRPVARNRALAGLTHRAPALARLGYQVKLRADRMVLPLVSRPVPPATAAAAPVPPPESKD